jgi:hypothetical protein
MVHREDPRRGKMHTAAIIAFILSILTVMAYALAPTLDHRNPPVWLLIAPAIGIVSGLYYIFRR